FAALQPLYERMHNEWSPGACGSVFLDLALAMAVLGVPTLLIGGTLPLMGRIAAASDRSITATFGGAYAVNTLGAVLGASASGFLLIRYAGMEKTQWIAIAASLTVVGLTLASRSAPGSPSSPQLARPEKGVLSPVEKTHPALMVTLAALTGATTFGMEVAWN